MKKRRVLCRRPFKLSRYSELPSISSRRKRRQRLLLALSAIVLCNPPIDRQIWMLPRTDHWYSIVQTKLSDKEWYSNFRLSRETFSYILSQISTEISHQDTKLRKAVSSEKCLAIYLYYLGSTAEYRTVANLFGVSNAFVCLCVKEVSQAIFRKMKKRLLCLPKGDDLKNVMAMYRQRWGFPMCAGAIDGTHIAIQAPPENHADYVNRKSYHSIVMQAVVDCQYLFRDVVIGWPGSVHDARVLSNSDLYNLGSKSQLFDDNMKKKILGVDIRPVILGDPAYPLLVWLMKAYPENINTPKWQRHFNYRLSRARMTVENTFGRWKGRFTRFSKRVDMAVESVTYLAAASCVVHNICELRRDDFFQEWLEVCNNSDQPENLPLPNEDLETVCESDATVVRDTLAQYFRTMEGKNIGQGIA